MYDLATMHASKVLFIDVLHTVTHKLTVGTRSHGSAQKEVAHGSMPGN